MRRWGFCFLSYPGIKMSISSAVSGVQHWAAGFRKCLVWLLLCVLENDHSTHIISHYTNSSENVNLGLWMCRLSYMCIHICVSYIWYKHTRTHTWEVYLPSSNCPSCCADELRNHGSPNGCTVPSMYQLYVKIFFHILGKIWAIYLFCQQLFTTLK